MNQLSKTIRANSPRSRRACLLASSALCALGLVSAGAHASVVTLDGSGSMAYSYQYVGPNSTTPTVGNTYVLGVPGQYTYTDTFTQQQTHNLGTSPVGAYDFQDSYEFTVGASASGDTLVAQLGLGSTFNISDLQFRLYEVPSATTVPTVGALPPTDTVLTLWKGPPTGQNSVSASFSGITGGATYVLDVAGIASGTNGGTYIGQLNLSPVPLPGAIWLLLSGIGGLAGLARVNGRVRPPLAIRA